MTGYRVLWPAVAPTEAGYYASPAGSVFAVIAQDFTDIVVVDFDLRRHPRHGAYYVAIGLINQSSARLRKERLRARVTADRASGCCYVAPSGRSTVAFGPRHQLLTCLPRRVHRWWLRRCIDSRPAATSPLRGIAWLHAVIFAVSAHRCLRLSPRRLPRCGSPCPRKVFVKPPGSSSPTLSTVTAPL
jgi:hypothetical protein